MDEDDAELSAIRARLRQEIMANVAAPGPAQQEQGAPERPIDVDDAGFESFVRQHQNVVVDCWAPWCGPCRIVGPIVDALAREMSGRVVFGKLNVDLSPGVAQAFGVQSIPTLLVFREARLVDRIVGALPKPQLAMALERHFGRRASGSPAPRRR
jgi:thioredoxin 1